MKSLIIVLSFLMLAPTIVMAVDADGNYAVWGVGKKSCFGFNKEMSGENNAKYKHYIKGFLTAYNIFTEKTFNIAGSMNEAEVLEWLNEYCADNPMSGLETALTSFTFDHYDKRRKSAHSSGGW
jgi:hypothetical protein